MCADSSFANFEVILTVGDGVPKLAQLGSQANSGERFGKLPESGNAGAGGEQDLASPAYDQERMLSSNHNFLLPWRQLVLDVETAGLALCRYRAFYAYGRARQAHGGAELHHSLIPSTWVALV